MNGPDEGTGTGQRIDRWLWHARVVRTRSAAAKLAGSGALRLNREHVRKPAQLVRIGDVLTLALGARVRVVEVTGLAERRGGADAARALYREVVPEGAAGRPEGENRAALLPSERDRD